MKSVTAEIDTFSFTEILHFRPILRTLVGLKQGQTHVDFQTENST